LLDVAGHGRIRPLAALMSIRDPLDVAIAAARRHLATLPKRPVRPDKTGQDIASMLPSHLPSERSDPAATIDDLATIVESGLLATGSPRFFGWVVGGTLPVALAADWLVSAWDSVGGVAAAGPALARIEDQAGRWLLHILDLPPSCSFGFTTGCQTAHVTALAAARHELLRRLGVDVERSGLAGSPRVRVLATDDHHITVDLALRYLGIGTDALTILPSDAQGRVHPDAVQEALAADESAPTIVLAQAGNIHTGAFEDFAVICSIAHQAGAWVHVDGAFGLWASASESLRHLTASVGLADSWATDAHKVLNTPYDGGFVACASPLAHRAAMSGTGSYVAFDDVERDPNAWVLEYSRRARAVPVWAALRTLGRSGVADLVLGLHARARQFADLLAEQTSVEILNEVVFNQVLVRFGDSDDVTQSVINAVQRSGVLWLGGSRWRDQLVARISVCNHATTASDVEQSAAALLAQFGLVSREAIVG
jgi:glutamate/tyrosine decarboxylase-like PLP-dependent enzyme